MRVDDGVDALRARRRLVLLRVGRRIDVAYSFRYSLSRLVWDRLTGISVLFASFILRM